MRKGKLFKILLILLAVTAVFLLGVRIYFRAPVREFYKNARKAFVIPDSNYGFVAQGIDYDEETGLFFLTGYTSNHMASPIYVVDEAHPENNKVVRMHLSDDRNNADNLTHAGGIAVHDDYVYVAGCRDRCVYVYSKSDILDASDGERVNSLGEFIPWLSDEDRLNVDYMTVHDGMLYIGEFFREENYPTDETHKFTTAAGDYNEALILGYRLSDEYDFGISNYPDIGYSAPGLVQGMAFHNGKIYLSTSYGTAVSHLYVYPASDKELPPVRWVQYPYKGVSLYDLDSSVLLEDISLPPMSEEIEAVGDELYIMDESASNKYIFGKFTGAKWCYALPLP